MRWLLILALLTPAWAAVTFDAVGPSSAGTANTATTSLTWSHTCSGTNRLLVVVVGFSAATDTGKSITSVTYNGVTMNSEGLVHSGGGTAGFVQMFSLKAPATGANNVVVTASTTVGLEAGSVSFNGVDQTTPTQNFNSASGSGVGPSLAVTSTVGDMVIDGEANGTNIPVTTKTARWSVASSNSTRAGNAGSSTAAGAASVTMGYTTSSDSWGMVGLDVKAAAATGVVRMRGAVISQ